MRFSRDRADAFASYTLPGLLDEAVKKDPSKYILWLRRSELAKILGMTNSRQEHVKYVSDQASLAGIVTGTISEWVYFFYSSIGDDFGMSVEVSRANAITEAFEKVYGSAAIDDLWERWNEEGISPDQPKAERKPKGHPSVKIIKVT